MTLLCFCDVWSELEALVRRAVAALPRERISPTSFMPGVVASPTSPQHVEQPTPKHLLPVIMPEADQHAEGEGDYQEEGVLEPVCS